MAFIVKTIVNGEEVDSQKVSNAKELNDNSFVKFKKKIRLEETAGDVFSGGTNGETTGEGHQRARDAFESYAFNVLAVPVKDKTELTAYANYTKRQREEYGVKFQMVCPYIEGQDYNYEGIIQYGNKTKDEGHDPVTSLCYWIAGAEAGCEIQNSVMAKEYNGSLTPDANLTRAQERRAIKEGIFVFHSVDRVPVVLKDINSLITINSKKDEQKTEDFKNNQTIRVLDGRSTEIALLFNTFYLAKYGNTDVNRAQLKSDIIRGGQALAAKQAIQPYDESAVDFQMGNTITDVIGYEELQPVNAMEKLFMSIQLI